MGSAPAALRPVHKLQVLADALALDFSQSLVSAQCSQALRGLLPGLEYLSIGVSNPAQGGAIVASTNCAAAGPTTLHLHDPQACAAGVALARGQPLQASLLNGAADTVAAAWSDVQLMLAQAPDVTHLLCIPFAPAGSDGSSAQASPGACQHHAGSSPGSGAGALLFGFAAAPQLDERRRAVLALLARCLPAPMARLSGDTLAFVNFATGSSLQCSCCCSAEEEEEEEEEEGEQEGGQQADVHCREDRGDGGGDGIGPSQAMRVPVAEDGTAGEEGGLPSDAAGPSSKAWWDEPAGGTGAAKAAVASQARTDLHSGRSIDRAHPEFRFSKPLMAVAEAEGAASVRQNSLTLAFHSPLVESEFGRWVAQHHCKVDILFSVLLLAAFVVICFVRPYRLIDGRPTSWLAGLGVVVPALAALLARSYATWRERFIIAIRIYVVACVNLVNFSTYEAHLPADRMQQWVTLFMLTGAESLAVTSLGFPVRLQLHLPLQFAAMGVAYWNLPHMCSECFPGQDAARCIKSGAVMAATFGCLFPTIVLRNIEQRSRALFANQLRAAAAHQA